MTVSLIPASAAVESTRLTVSADKTVAVPGDTITFTVTMGPVSDCGTIAYVLDIPSGLTYVADSGKVADGVKEAMGYDDFSWTEVSLMTAGVASAADYESDKDTVLSYFQCTVDENCPDSVSVGLKDLEFCSCQTWKDHTDRFSVEPAVIKRGVSSTAGKSDTGENPILFIYIGVFAVSATALIFTFFRRKRKILSGANDKMHN